MDESQLQSIQIMNKKMIEREPEIQYSYLLCRRHIGEQCGPYGLLEFGRWEGEGGVGVVDNSIRDIYSILSIILVQYHYYYFLEH